MCQSTSKAPDHLYVCRFIYLSGPHKHTHTEKLQFHFNEHIFRLEQEVYLAEGVHVPATTFKDNRLTLLLLEEKASGIFAMIDEEGNVPKGSDESYLNKVKTKHGKNENIVMPKPSTKVSR